MKKQYDAPTIASYNSSSILEKIGPANAVYP